MRRTRRTQFCPLPPTWQHQVAQPVAPPDRLRARLQRCAGARPCKPGVRRSLLPLCADVILQRRLKAEATCRCSRSVGGRLVPGRAPVHGPNGIVRPAGDGGWVEMGARNFAQRQEQLAAVVLALMCRRPCAGRRRAKAADVRGRPCRERAPFDKVQIFKLRAAMNSGKRGFCRPRAARPADVAVSFRARALEPFPARDASKGDAPTARYCPGCARAPASPPPCSTTSKRTRRT